MIYIFIYNILFLILFLITIIYFLKNFNTFNLKYLLINFEKEKNSFILSLLILYKMGIVPFFYIHKYVYNFSSYRFLINYIYINIIYIIYLAKNIHFLNSDYYLYLSIIILLFFLFNSTKVKNKYDSLFILSNMSYVYLIIFIV